MSFNEIQISHFQTKICKTDYKIVQIALKIQKLQNMQNKMFSLSSSIINTTNV